MNPLLVERHIVLGGICNLRDLGGYPVGGGGNIRWRRVLRSDSLHDLNDSGIEALLDAGLASVIDLRDASEIARQPNPFHAHRAVKYSHIPLFAHLDLKEHLAGAAGVDDMLLGLYCEVLTQRQPALAEALAAIANAGPGAVLFHCTVGKDRTGVLAALVLAAVGASPEDIVADYALSAARIDRIRKRMLAKFSADGADIKSLLPLFSSEPATMRGMLDFLDNRYGGIDAYLHILDPDRILREKLRARMLS
jgi:protein-tyrosine phosphatase